MMQAQYAPATELMLDLADVRPGDRVLDVAAGDGYQSIAAARRVGPAGHVLAVDLAPEQLKHAAAAAGDAGIGHLETRVMDGENLDLADASVDAVLCQFGLMLFGDPYRGLTEMWRVLKPGGRVSIVIFAAGGTPASDLVTAMVRARLGEPTPEANERLGRSLGIPGVLEGRLKAAGFRTIEAHQVPVPLRMASAAQAASFLREVHPALEEASAPLTEQAREDLWHEIAAALAGFESQDGFESPEEALVVAGRRPIDRTT